MLDQLKRNAKQLLKASRQRYRVMTSAERMSPSFITIGTQKGGTTSLHWNLTGHPQIDAPRKKELHFFDRHYAKGTAWYLANFSKRAPHMITGESTPCYLFIPYVPARMKALLPHVKLIALLRDPISRAHSQYYMSLRKGQQSEDFEFIIRQELRHLQQQPLDRATYEQFVLEWVSQSTLADNLEDMDYQPNPKAYGYHFRGYLLRGLYVRQLEIWFDHFPREQFWIGKSEDYFRDPLGMIETLSADFLGLERWRPADYQAENQGFKYPKMSETLRLELATFFEPYNRELYALLGRDMGW